MFKKLKFNLDKITEKVESSNSETPISDSLQYNISYLKEKFGDSFDIIYKYSDVGKSKVCFVMADGMCNNMLVVEQIMRPILTAEKLPSEPRKMLNYISANVVAGIDQSETQTLERQLPTFCRAWSFSLLTGRICAGVMAFKDFLREVSMTHNSRLRKRAHTRDLPRALRITSHFCEDGYALPF